MADIKKVARRFLEFAVTHKLITAAVINLLILVLSFVVSFPKYAMFDEWACSLDFANNRIETHFMNFFIAKFFCIIQQFFSNTNTYTVCLILFSYLSYCVIQYIFISKYGFKGLCVSTLLCAAFAPCNYCIINFTTAAAALTVSGFLLLINLINDKKLSVLKSALCVLLIITGFSLRKQLFFVGLFSFLVYIFINVIVDKWSKESSITVNLKTVIKAMFGKRFLAFTLCIVIAFFSVYTISDRIYYSTPGEQLQKNFNSIRSAIYDYNLPSYEYSKEAFSEINYSETEYRMILSWYLDVDGAQSIEKLKELRDVIRTEEPRSIKYVPKKILLDELNNIKELNQSGIFFVVMAVTILASFILLKGKYKLFSVAFAFIAAVFYFYLYYTGRYPFRAVLPVILFAVIFALIKMCEHIRANDNRRTLRRTILSFVFIAAIFGLYFNTVYLSTYNTTYYEDGKTFYNPDLLEKYTQETECEYMCGVSASFKMRFGEESFINPFLKRSNDEEFCKLLTVDATYIHTNYYDNKLKKFGIANPYRDIVNNDSLCFIDDSASPQIDMLCEYAHKWYYSQYSAVEADKITNIGNFVIYKLHTVN